MDTPLTIDTSVGLQSILKIHIDGVVPPKPRRKIRLKKRNHEEAKSTDVVPGPPPNTEEPSEDSNESEEIEPIPLTPAEVAVMLEEVEEGAIESQETVEFKE
eukprot:1052852_1